MKVKLVILSTRGIISERICDDTLEYYAPSLGPDQWAQIWFQIPAIREEFQDTWESGWIDIPERWELIVIIKR